MTKEEFIEQMLNEVSYHKQMLEQAELHRVKPAENVTSPKIYLKYITFNPFLEFDEKYFNIKLLSNLQGLSTVMYRNPDVNVHQIKLFIVCNEQFKILNQVLHYNPYMVEELKDETHSPMDIAIAYARYCELQDRYQNTPKR